MVSRATRTIIGGFLVLLAIASTFAYLAPSVLQPETVRRTTTVTRTDTVTETSAATTTTTVTTTAVTTTTTESEVRPEPLRAMRVEVAFPQLSFERMVYLTPADDGTNRLFLVLQPGVILIFPNQRDTGSASVFLDIQERVNDLGNEEGLLGLAFDPNYETNGFFYVYYTASPPRRSVLSRFSASSASADRADPASELILLEVPQPFANHNGGALAFGPDGYLYLGLGDGGSAGDRHGHGQNLSTLLGSLLRLDVRASSIGEKYRIPSDNPFVGRSDARGEIWAYGFRNPWRFSFDRSTGLLWAGDVGQNSFEEVDSVKRGGNYGWNVMEGFHCFPTTRSGCDTSGLELPVTEYTHADGCSVTGGPVYRGSRLPSLYGAYVYADFCSGKIWGLRYQGGRVIEHLELVDTPLAISSFGEDAQGEMYILSFDGRIYLMDLAE